MQTCILIVCLVLNPASSALASKGFLIGDTQGGLVFGR